MPNVLTKLPLARWFQLIGIHPLHGFGVIYRDEPTVCGQPWLAEPWMGADRVSRSDLAQAIRKAEDDIERYLHFRLLPAWEIDEWHEAVKSPSSEMQLHFGNAVGKTPSIQCDYGYLLSGGIRSKEEVQAAAVVTYTDADNDGYKETATVTVTTDLPVCELHVYFAGHGAEDSYEIRPIKITVLNGVVTITFRREVAVLPELWEMVVPADDHWRGVDGASDLSFAATVDLYRVYNDPQQQVIMLWEPFASSCGFCSGDGGCPQCSYAVNAGCLTLRSGQREGIVGYRVANWNETTLQFDQDSCGGLRAPDILRLYYYGGWRDRHLTCSATEMDIQWAQAVAYYAAALLDRPLCECNNIKAFTEHWQRDLAVPGIDEGIRIDPSDLRNPFGTRRGALHAWRIVRQQAIGR
jgi:hypothetical protein